MHESTDRLRHAIDHASHLLPAQGPITVFIHHNTLHAFEDATFDEAVVRGGRTFGCEPYLKEERFRAELAKGRIRMGELRDAVLDDEAHPPHQVLGGLVSRIDLRLALLQYPIGPCPAAELEWFMAENESLRHMRPEVPAAIRLQMVAETRRYAMRDLSARATGEPSWAEELFRSEKRESVERWSDEDWEAFTLQALWRISLSACESCPPAVEESTPSLRFRQGVFEQTGEDIDLPVNDLLTRFCAAFLDQGIARSLLPDREKGFYLAFLSLFRRGGGPPDRWLKSLAVECARLQDGSVGALACAKESLERMGVGSDELDAYIGEMLLVLRGWAGMIHHVAVHGDRVAFPIPASSLDEFVAVRLLLDRLAAQTAAPRCGHVGELTSFRAFMAARRISTPLVPVATRAYPLFHLAQILGWSPEVLRNVAPGQWREIVEEVESFMGIERRRVFQLAYERRFRNQTLDALALHPPRTCLGGRRPRFQTITCIDEREESFRRHLEEVASDCETFAAAGFFGVAMYFRGAADAHFVPLCPIVIKPGHWVSEVVEEGVEKTHRRRAKARKAFGTATHRFHLGTRSFATGAVLSAGVGTLASIPLIARVLFPRFAVASRQFFGRLLRTPHEARLKLERTGATPGPEIDRQGYSLDEMVNIAERLLRDIGMTVEFAPLVFVMGHGSHSMNNPHESDHDCGACGGAIGGPNGRALALMLNDPRVREAVARRGVVIPNDTCFVGGLHNTCNEYVKFPDEDLIPESHRERLAAASADIERALDRNAHERARRFGSAPLSLTPAGARRHMDARAEDLAQVRPEWGHATNALCIVARRLRTRGLYLDRRAFLVSYDPHQDDVDGFTLARLLGAAVPVCSGINLEYYFSHVDSPGYGCGTKLPHNITSLLGVMDGAASDLRTGLPWQMVEIHEPVRLLFVIETKAEVLLKVMDRNPAVGGTIRKGWVQLAIQDPDTGRISLFRNDRFEPLPPQASALPTAETSADWYRGWRDHLEFAEIGTP